MANSHRIRFGLYGFGILLFIYSRKIASLNDAISSKKSMHPYYYKAIDVMLRRSFFVRHHFPIHSLLFLAMSSQMFYTCCLYSGLFSFLKLFFVLLTAVCLASYLAILLYFFVYLFVVSRRIVKRYEEKYEHSENL